MSYKSEIILNSFQELIHGKLGATLDSIKELKAGASERKIYRLSSNGNSVIGIYNENVKENLAFIKFTEAFIRLGFKVPLVMNVSDDNLFYIQEDLGDVTLFSLSHETDREILHEYHKASLADLVRFQIEARDEIDYDYCYQTKTFSPDVLMQDFEKFNEHFNKVFIKNNLSEDFINDTFLDLASVISKAEKNFFLYRDFQPRNIMIKNNVLYYIDYQSGRMGPLQYDVASFLYSGSIDLTEDQRESLIEFYVNELNRSYEYDENEFKFYFYYFAFARIVQIIGSYGYLYKTRNDSLMLDKMSKAVGNMMTLENRVNNDGMKSFIEAVANSEL